VNVVSRIGAGAPYEMNSISGSLAVVRFECSCFYLSSVAFFHDAQRLG
jgi:hypothetical protein